MSTYEISKSSLLSLKAEILRKQEEVNKEKLLNKAKAAQGIKKGSPLDLKNKGVDERQQNDNFEDEDLLKKSRSALEAKALLYDKLSKGGTNRDDDARYLVQFRKKNTNLPPSDSEDDVDRYPESEEDERHFSDEYEPARNPDEEWVEYVDCLGRTRKCMRKDLPYLKERDSDLKSKGSNSDNEENNQQENDDKQAGDFDENSELLSNDMRTELLRRKWETEEDELRKKSDIHYQDILFDEARVHGVGYYGFSKDEKERARQQEALKKLREETQREQRKAEQLRQMRDKQLAARTRAAKNRKRARLGLPPEEENEEEVTKTTESDNDESAEKEKTPEEIAIEKERELMREKHIRPWDYGKEGVKEHIEYTQEDWVHKQRRERKEEFAPPSSYVEDKNSLYFTSKKESKTKDKECKKDSFYIDTSRPPPKINNPSKRKVNPYKTEEQEDSHKTKKFEPKPIVDECIDFDDEQNELMKDYLVFKERFETEERGRGAEIAPPPTFEYYGPSGSKRIKPHVKKVAIEDSISAGLQFLRQQAEKKKNSTNHMEDMFLI
ncbi:hypothetical protein MML48_6g00005168 [Holotrichia oblita]|uniref:Uncharacterized protein n=1 Tax=Holotrichia oblita TaxID=644536 RepID=A0ACB9T0R9_HOLOL|nr:hypothetical protein MML48_6g00005168 [Holotrichia oblita]